VAYPGHCSTTAKRSFSTATSLVFFNRRCRHGGDGLLITVVIGAFDLKLVWIGLLIMLFALLGLLGRYLRWKTIEFVITPTESLFAKGSWPKRHRDSLERVMNISYRQALWERILGTGISY